MAPVVPLVASDDDYSNGSATVDSFAPNPVSLEPFPMQYHQQAQIMSQPSLTYYTPCITQPVLPPMPQRTVQPVDSILDEAVDDLFLSGDDTLADFCFDWDPSGAGMPLDDDTQLGYMLEKLLED